jgi:predicted nucleic acid-binding Zn ribbon protein
MNDANLFSLGDALKSLLKKHGLEHSINEHRIREAWHKTVGDYCSKHTQNISFSKGELTVRISSAPVKHELLYAKTEVITKINELIGCEIVTSLRIF